MAETTRERVRDLLARDWTVLEISRELRISPQAVYKHKNALDAQPPRPKRRAS